MEEGRRGARRGQEARGKALRERGDLHVRVSPRTRKRVHRYGVPAFLLQATEPISGRRDVQGRHRGGPEHRVRELQQQLRVTRTPIRGLRSDSLPIPRREMEKPIHTRI